MEVIYVDKETNEVLMSMQSEVIPKEGETINLSNLDDSSEVKLYYVHQVVHNIVMDTQRGVLHRARVYLRK